MNYLKEIVEFGRWKEVNQLPATAIALWHELMSICNKCGWKTEFTVPNPILQVNAGISRKQLDHARQLLISKGRIHYKKSGRVNQAGTYSMVPFVQNGQQEGQQNIPDCSIGATGSTTDGTQKGQQEAHERDTLFKRNQSNLNQSLNNKQGISNVFDEVIPLEEDPLENIMGQICRAYEESYGRTANLTQISELVKFVENDNFEPELVKHAIKLARLDNASLRFALWLCKDWAEKGIQTVVAAKEEEREFYTKRSKANGPNLQVYSGKKGYGKPVIQDKLPSAVQRQLEREQQEQPTHVTQKQTIMDDPELKELYESLRQPRRNQA
ncbi:DnaD domain protein [Brevibacterium sp. JNUCC-42]|nr:DnaD domain protein [Brevibacterium sp. JNUCC-42]